MTPHFRRAEMVVTSTGLVNQPRPRHWCSLQALCSGVLEVWRERVGPIRITSGFRSPEVNVRINGSRDSQHMRGEAADCQPLGMDRLEAWLVLVDLIGAGLPVDQAIAYEAVGGGVDFIHISHTSRYTARRELRVQALAGGCPLWEDYTGPLKETP